MKTGKQAKTVDGTAHGRVVLVGTYKGDQLTHWPGWYCRPLDGGNVASLKMLPVANPNCQSRPWENWKPATFGNGNISTMATLSSVTELRLYRGASSGADYGKRMKETA